MKSLNWFKELKLVTRDLQIQLEQSISINSALII